MRKWWYNDGLGDNAIKNQFTAYLQVAVRRHRIRYLKKETKLKNELIANQYKSFDKICDKPDMHMGLPILDQIENPHLQRLLRDAKPIDRYVLYAKAIEHRSFPEIAKVTGKNNNTIAAIYYRIIKKFKKGILEGKYK